MFKFFRRIRYNLIGTSKTVSSSEAPAKAGKYLKYAFGEVILVVIGILIALQINNWNQLKKDGNTERKYLINIISDLNEQLAAIQTQKKYEKGFIDTTIPLITYYNDHLEFLIDSTFFAKISSLNTRKTFITTDPTFTDLVSSGNIKLFKNDTLKKKIISYYQEIELSEKIIQNNNTLIVDQQYGAVIKELAYYYVTQTNRYLDNIDSLDVDVKEAADKLSYYNSNLAQTSKNILASPENQLLLMNGLNQRANVCIAHYQRALILENKTNDLIQEIETVLNEKTF
jgi:hypothetical protein